MDIYSMIFTFAAAPVLNSPEFDKQIDSYPRRISLIALSNPFFPGFASIGVQPSRTQVVCRRWQMLRRATLSRWCQGQDFSRGPVSGCSQRYGGFHDPLLKISMKIQNPIHWTNIHWTYLWNNIYINIYHPIWRFPKS